MPRKRRPFIPDTAVRDARLIVIATEDTKATNVYFRTLASPSFYRSSKVHVEVLGREETASSPEHVIRELEKWIREYQIDHDDELWLVIDVDRWGDAKLSRIAQKCRQKGIRLAVSNPAVELWFLLHWTDLTIYDAATQAELLANAKVNAKRTRLEQAILDIAGSYNKSRFDARPYMPHVPKAIERAERLDVRPEDRWPQQLGTRVYLVARSIVASALSD